MSSSSYELILTSSPDGPITVYDAASATVVAQFSGSRSPCRGLTMVGQRLIAASHVSSDTGTGSINIYNWFSSIPFQNISLPEPVAPLIATLDGAFLFGGGISGSILSLSADSGDVIRSVSAHSRAVSCLHLSDDGSLVVSGSDDGTIVVVPTFKIVAVRANSLELEEKDLILHKWKAHSDSVTALKSLRGTLVSCSVDCTCKFWNLGDNGVLMRIVEFPCAIFGVALDLDSADSSTGSRFYAAGADGLVYNGAMKVVEEVMRSSWCQSHGGSIVSLVLVNEGKNLVSAADDGSVWMWDVEKGEVTMVLVGNEMVLMQNISDMVGVKGINDVTIGNNYNNNVAIDDQEGDNNYNNGSLTSYGLCEEEMMKTLKKITELGEVGDVVLQDKKKAIHMLESTIEIYVGLLKLILREATKAIEEGAEEDEEEE